MSIWRVLEAQTRVGMADALIPQTWCHFADFAAKRQSLWSPAELRNLFGGSHYFVIVGNHLTLGPP
jgi:hypothetical protein